MKNDSNLNADGRIEISRQRIIDDLKKIGVEKGDHLGIGLSFKRIGHIIGGPETFIDAVLEAIGPDGTLMMNTYTEFFYLTELRLGWTDYIFDVNSTEVNTGIVPETFRKREKSIRSRHPTNSNTALGKFAQFLTEDHDENASAYLPYSKLASINGKYLAIGIGDRMVGFRHRAQYEAGLLNIVPWKRGVKYKDKNGNIKIFILKDRGGCTRKLPELVSKIRKEGLVQDGKIGMADAVLLPAKESLERMSDLLKNNPLLNLCENPLCLWCREIEKRLNLYDRIENPKYFQENKFVIFIISLINRLRELDNRLVARTKLIIKRKTL